MASKYLLLSILIVSICSLSSGQRLTEDCLEKAGILRISEIIRNPTKCSEKDVENIKKMANYLIKYGYLPEEPIKKNLTVFNVKNALLMFNFITQLGYTDELNEQTLEKMKERRCGVKDFTKGLLFRGELLFMNNIEKWSKKDLTWSLRNFAKHTSLSHNRQLEIIRNAFRHWEKNSNLKFKEVNGMADIKLSFETGNLGNNLTFDRPVYDSFRKMPSYRYNVIQPKILGRAFFPPHGRVHFNNDVYWTDSFSIGVDLEYMALHEIGHALGLPHNGRIKSVMGPFYPKTRPNFKLGNFDVREIQLFYGKKKNI